MLYKNAPYDIECVMAGQIDKRATVWRPWTTSVFEGGFRRLKLAGHCVRHPEEEASKLVLWQPTIGHMNVGRRAITYMDTLMRDTNLASVEELRTAMMDREDWRRRADSKRVETRPK